jgi:hypothetical protein
VPGNLFAGKTIENTYSAPYEKVWNAARRAAMRLDAKSQKTPLSGVTIKYRKVTILDKDNGIIQLGAIPKLGEMEKLDGLGVTSEGYIWRDEFHIKITPLSSTQTKVSVLRRVVVGVYSKDPLHPSFGDKLQERASSGNYERWLLTQIEDDLAGKLKRESIAIIQLKPSEPPKVEFNYTSKKLNIKSGLSLGMLKYSFTVNGSELTSSLIRSQMFEYLSAESASLVEQLFNAFRDSLRLFF